MSSNQFKNGFHVGGSIEQALKGEIDIKPVDVLQEAWKITLRNYVRFLPAIFLMFAAQIAIFLISLQIQSGGEVQALFMALMSEEGAAAQAVSAFHLADFWKETLSGPFVAGVSLMALSHAIGLPTQPRHIFKGFSIAIPATLLMLIMSSVNGLASSFSPLLGGYFTMAFSLSMLLVCEKKLPPHHAILISLRAINKKILPMMAIFMVIFILFLFALVTLGLGLMVVLPFYFNVKGILYREFFGVTLQVVSTEGGASQSDQFEA